MPAIAFIEQKWSDAVSTVSEAEGWFVTEIEVTFNVTTTDATASTEYVRKNAPFPAYGSPHPDNPLARCTGEPIVNQLSPIFYTARIKWRTPPKPQGDDDGGGGSGSDNPPSKDKEPEYEEWSSVETQEDVDQDADGKAVCTVLGEQFDPPITKRFADMQCTLHQNLAALPRATMAKLNHTNSNNLLGYAPGEGLFIHFTGRDFLDPTTGLVYWRCTFTFLFRNHNPNLLPANVWRYRTLAQGYLVKNTAGQVIRAKNTAAKSGASSGLEDGTESPKPVLHNATVGNVDVGKQIDNPVNAQWYTFKLYPSADFTNLNL